MKVNIKKDGEGYLAEVEGYDHIYAYGDTPELAKKELLGVIEMMIDYHSEQIENDKKIKNIILSYNMVDYAI